MWLNIRFLISIRDNGLKFKPFIHFVCTDTIICLLCNFCSF